MKIDTKERAEAAIKSKKSFAAQVAAAKKAGLPFEIVSVKGKKAVVTYTAAERQAIQSKPATQRTALPVDPVIADLTARLDALEARG